MNETQQVKRSYDSKITNGCSRIGTLKATYADLVEAFGEPNLNHESGDGKVKTIWVFSTPRGPVTIYDYKPTQAPENVTEWSVGGKKAEAYLWIRDEFNEAIGLCGGCGKHITRCSMQDFACRPF